MHHKQVMGQRLLWSWIGKKQIHLGLKPLAKFRSFAVGGVPPEIMGIGPVAAVPKALKLAGLELADIGLFEFNEAFASQSIQIIRELGLMKKWSM